MNNHNPCVGAPGHCSCDMVHCIPKVMRAAVQSGGVLCSAEDAIKQQSRLHQPGIIKVIKAHMDSDQRSAAAVTAQLAQHMQHAA